VPLGLKSFAYGRPDWITDFEIQDLEGMARAALLLLLFERTYSGCWSKTYIYRLASLREDLPLAHGSLTGSPLAILAISALVDDHDRLAAEFLFPPISKTIAELLGPDGSYLRGYDRGATMGTAPRTEPPRHAAGGLLLALLTGGSGLRHEATLKWLCLDPRARLPYDQAITFRALAEASTMPWLTSDLAQLVGDKKRSVLDSLLTAADAEPRARRIWSNSAYGYQTIPTNQWGTVFWMLPALNDSEIAPKHSQHLASLMRQFLLTHPATEASSPDFPHDSGDVLFGDTEAVASWRTLELFASDTLTDRNQAIAQIRNLVSRLLKVWPTALVAALEFEEGKSDSLKGYLIWSGLCLVSATLGVRITADQAIEEVELVNELNTIAQTTSSDTWHEAFHEAIKHRALFSPDMSLIIAQLAAQVQRLYLFGTETSKHFGRADA